MKALRVPIELRLGFWHVPAPDLGALPRDCTPPLWSQIWRVVGSDETSARTPMSAKAGTPRIQTISIQRMAGQQHIYKLREERAL